MRWKKQIQCDKDDALRFVQSEPMIFEYNSINQDEL